MKDEELKVEVANSEKLKNNIKNLKVDFKNKCRELEEKSNLCCSLKDELESKEKNNKDIEAELEKKNEMILQMVLPLKDKLDELVCEIKEKDKKLVL